MKKILTTTLLLGALLLSAHPAAAQVEAAGPASPWTAGFVLGVNGGKVTNLTSVSWSMRPGLMLGGFLNLALSRVFSFESQLYFTQKGAQHTEDITLGTVTSSINISYFEIPLLFKITIPLGQDFLARPRFFGGAYAGYMTRAVLKQAYEDYTGSDATVAKLSNMKSLETGYIVGAGVEFDVKGGLFSIDGRYSESFGTISSDPPTKKNRVLTLVLAFAFR